MDRRASERIIVFVYSVYAVALMFATTILGWPSWITPITSIGILAVWFAYLRTIKNYRFRALLYSAIVLATFLLYNTQENSFGGILTTFCAAILVLGILDIPDIVVPEYIFTVLLVVYHLFFGNNVPMGTTQERIRSAVQILSAFAVVGITHHLTKKHWTINRQLTQMIENLKAAEQSKMEFLSDISQAFRAPVNAIYGASEMILQESVPDSVREDTLDIQTSGRGLLSMINDLKDYSALESGGMALVEAPYHLPVVINDVINMALAYKGEKDLELIVDCSADIPNLLMGDEQKLRRVILKLVGNAIKFTEAGGVTLMLSARPEEYGVNLSVRVTDTGAGISEEHQERIFSDFPQADAKVDGGYDGIGLGLIIVKKLVTNMNGWISVRSKPGKGSEFQFVIPQKVADQRPIAAVQDAENISVIFYINTEKESFNEIRDHYLSSIRRMMEGLGLRCHQCRNLGEMKRRTERENFTHALITENEYLEDREFFDRLSEKIRIMLIQERESTFVPGGSIVTIRKPFYVSTLAAAFNDRRAAGAMHGGAPGKRFTAPEASVLVVDDNMLNLNAAEGLLRSYGIKVVTASGGEECIAKLENIRIDLIFMDHMMPNMNGIETAGRIRRMQGGRFGNVPIVALTAYAVEGAREMFLNEGFQEYIAKPIEITHMEHVLRTYLPADKLLWEEAPAPEPPAQRESPKPRHIDREKGIRFMGGKPDVYESILDVYLSEGREVYEKLNKCYDWEDWRGYTILVHSLKSNSFGIGADGLGERAKALEAAAKSGDAGYIREHHEGTMALFREVLSEIREGKPDEKAGPPAEAEPTDSAAERGEGQ